MPKKHTPRVGPFFRKVDSGRRQVRYSLFNLGRAIGNYEKAVPSPPRKGHKPRKPGKLVPI